MAKPFSHQLDPPPVRDVRSLTGLRFVMAITVFVSHVAVMMPVPYINDVLNLAGMGGTFFLVLSGFALTWSFRGTDRPAWFLGRRMARIWPTLLVAIALPLAFALGQPGTDIGHMVGAALAGLFFLQAWIPPVVLESTNPVTWMLSCVVAFYLIYVWLGRYALSRRPRQLAILFGAAMVYGWAVRILLWALYPPTQPLALENAGGLTFGVYSPFGRIHEFLFGVFAAAAMRRGWRVPVSIAQIMGLMVVALGFLWLMRDASWRSAVPHDPIDLVMAPLFALFLAACTQREVDGGRSVFGSAPLVRLGKWSLVMYLFHFTVIFTVAAMVYPDKSLVDFFLDPVTPVNEHWLWMGVSLAVTLVLSWLIHRFYEAPIERRLRAWLTARFAARSAERKPPVAPQVSQGD